MVVPYFRAQVVRDFAGRTEESTSLMEHIARSIPHMQEEILLVVCTLVSQPTRTVQKRPGDDILCVLIQSVFVSNATKIYKKTSENQGVTDSLNVFQYDSYIHWELA